MKLNGIRISTKSLILFACVAVLAQSVCILHAMAGQKVQENPDAYAKAAFENARLGRFDAAVDGYSHAIKLNKNNIDYYKMRANAEMGANQTKRAVADWTKVLSVMPQDSSTYIARAKSYDVLKDYSKEKKDLDKFLFFQPSSASGLLLRATCDEHLGNSQEVLTDCNAALNSGGLPREILKEVYRLKSAAYQKLGRKPESEQELIKYRSLQ